MASQGLEQHGEKMDGVYRWTRYVYDWTRPFFLFGRDALVDGLNPPQGGRVCELGCGTAHNLIRLARRRPDLQIIGVDASVDEVQELDGSDFGKDSRSNSPVQQ